MTTANAKKRITPKGFHSITPMMTVRGAATLIDFLKEAFRAREIMRMKWPDGKIMHAELRLGDSALMLCDATETWQPTQSELYLYVDDVDEAHRRALDAGATSVMEPADQFYGDRLGVVIDQSGNRWSIATHIEDVSTEELQRRQAEWLTEHPGKC